MLVWIYFNYIYSYADVTLGEGNTPLIRSVRIGPTLGLPGLMLPAQVEGWAKSKSFISPVGCTEFAGCFSASLTRVCGD
jgi:hypothetical protein